MLRRISSRAVVARRMTPPQFAAPNRIVATRLWSAVPEPPQGTRDLERAALEHDEDSVTQFLKCIDKEIDDETLRMDKEAPNLAKGWALDHDEGTRFWTMQRQWKDEQHRIKVRLTSRDTSLDPECDLRGEHFPFTLQVIKQVNNKVMDFTMDIIEGECVVDNIRVYDASLLETPGKPLSIAQKAASAMVRDHFERQQLWPGPNLDETEEEVLDGVQAFLAERQIDDQLAEFIGQYSVWIEQLEYERWLKQLRNFVAT